MCFGEAHHLLEDSASAGKGDEGKEEEKKRSDRNGKDRIGESRTPKELAVRQGRRLAAPGLTRAVGGDDGLGRDAHAAVIHRQLLAGQALGPRVAVLDEDGLAALPGPLAHRLAGLDGLVLEVDGADGRVHRAEEEEQVGAAVGAQQTFELLDGQDGVGLRAVVQVVGHLRHVPGQGLAQGDADRLAGCGAGSGHAEQAERSQGEQRGPQQQPPSRAAADHDPGGTGHGGSCAEHAEREAGSAAAASSSPWNWTRRSGSLSSPGNLTASEDQIPPMGSHELHRAAAAAAPAAPAALAARPVVSASRGSSTYLFPVPAGKTSDFAEESDERKTRGSEGEIKTTAELSGGSWCSGELRPRVTERC